MQLSFNFLMCRLVESARVGIVIEICEQSGYNLKACALAQTTISPMRSFVKKITKQKIC